MWWECASNACDGKAAWCHFLSKAWPELFGRNLETLCKFSGHLGDVVRLGKGGCSRICRTGGGSASETWDLAKLAELGNSPEICTDEKSLTSKTFCQFEKLLLPASSFVKRPYRYRVQMRGDTRWQHCIDNTIVPGDTTLSGTSDAGKKRHVNTRCDCQYKLSAAPWLQHLLLLTLLLMITHAKCFLTLWSGSAWMYLDLNTLSHFLVLVGQ